MTKMQLMQMIMTWDREANNPKLSHMTDTGILIRNANLIQSGKIEQASKDAQLVKVDAQMISNLRSKLSMWDKQFMAKQRNYFNGETKQVNEVLYRMKHRVLNAEEFYIPEVVDGNYLITEIGKGDTYNIFVKQPGATSELKSNAKQPLIIDGLETVMSKHVSDIASYIGMAIPIRNFAKVFNGMNLSLDAPISVKNSIAKNFGEHANEILVQGIRDVQGSRNQTGLDRLSRKMTALYSSFNKLALVGKIGVTIKQAASYQSAGSILSRRALIVGNRPFYSKVDNSKSPCLIEQLFMAPNSKTARSLFAEIDKYTPLHYLRRQGMSMQEIAFEKMRSTKTKRFMQGVGASMEQNAAGRLLRRAGQWVNPINWIQRMDVATTGALWVACKWQSKYDGYQIGTDEFFRHATELYQRVIRETQPMYDSLHRAEVQKGTGFTKYLFPFKTVPFQNKGQIFNAIGEYSAAIQSKNKSEIKRTGKFLYNTVEANVRSVLIFSALSLVARIVQHKMDDDEELTAKSICKTVFHDFLGVMASNISPLFGTEIMEFIDHVIVKFISGNSVSGYDLFQVGMLDLINDTYESLVGFTDGISDWLNGDITFEEFASVAADSMMQFAAFFGIPAKNVVDIFTAISLHVQDAQTDGFLSFTSDKKLSNAERLYNAMLSGDEEMTNRYSAQFKTDRDLHNAVRKQLRENDARITEAATALMKGDIQKYESIVNEIIKEGHFSKDDVVSAIRSQKTATENMIRDIYEMFFGSEEETASEGKLYTLDDYMAAVAGGQTASANNAKEYIIQGYIDSGKTQAKGCFVPYALQGR